MLVVRCTSKLLRRVNVEPGLTSASSTTRLGDWYATVLPWRPRDLVLLVNEGNRLPVVLPACQLATLGATDPRRHCPRARGPWDRWRADYKEYGAMATVTFAKTASRSALGTMNEFVLFLEHLLPSSPHLTDQALGMRLGQVLVTVPPLGYQHPAEVATRILA